MLFVSERRDLISKVMFSFRDLLLQSTDFQWHYFFITCLPTILIGNLHAPFPTMIGLLRDLFDFDALEEMIELQRQAIGTPWETAGPCIIDIDQGKVYELEHYHAIVRLRQIMESNAETAHMRSQALNAQNRLAEIENKQQSNEPILIPSFLSKILDGRTLQQLQQRGSGTGNAQDISLLATEIDSALKDGILKKSPLYLELTRLPASFKHSAGREQMLSKGGTTEIGASPSRIRTLQNAKLAGFAPGEQDQVRSLTNVEVVQKQILKYFDQTQFQKVVSQKNQQIRRSMNTS